MNLDADPAWSPDGSRIAVGFNGAIHVMNADGTDAAQLTSHIDYHSSPAWSLDCTRIAFAAERRYGYVDIYVVDTGVACDQPQVSPGGD